MSTDQLDSRTVIFEPSREYHRSNQLSNRYKRGDRAPIYSTKNFSANSTNPYRNQKVRQLPYQKFISRGEGRIDVLNMTDHLKTCKCAQKKVQRLQSCRKMNNWMITGRLSKLRRPYIDLYSRIILARSLIKSIVHILLSTGVQTKEINCK